MKVTKPKFERHKFYSGLNWWYMNGKLKKVLKMVGVGGVALDFGCWLGHFLPTLTNNYHTIYAVDIDKSYLTAAEKNMKEHYAKTIKDFKDCNIYYHTSTKGLPNKSCDIIFMLDVLEHLKDRKEVYNEIKRILKPDGSLIITMPLNNKWRKNLMKILRIQEAECHKVFNAQEVVAELQDNFKIRETKYYPSLFPISYTMRCANE